MRKSQKPKQQPKHPKPEPASLYDEDVVAPEELDIGEFCTNAEREAWWVRMRVYVKTAHSLNRAVLVKYIADDKKFYLSSVPEVIT